MKANQSIQEACIRLIENKPFNKITIEDICKEAHVSRSTFYKNYKDKYDVIETIYKNDTIYALNELLKILPMTDEKFDMITHEWFFQRFYDRRSFYKKIMLSCGDNWFLNIFITSCTDITKQYTQDIAASLSPIIFDYTCYYLAAGQAMLLKRWIEEDCPISPKELAKSYYEWSSSYWRRTFDIK